MRGSFVRFTATVATVALLAIAGNAGAADKDGGGKKKSTRYGLGVNLNRVDVRFEMDKGYALDGFLGFDFQSGKIGDSTEVSIGGYYLQRLKDRDPVGLHLLGGLAYVSGDTEVTVPAVGAVSAKMSDFVLFGGLGCEYYFPGTKKLSLEGQIGLSLHLLSSKAAGTTTTGTQLQVGDLTDGILMLRYYFD